MLDAHGMDHLDLSQITADKRPVTQTIGADLHDCLGAAGIRFPSRLDGNACVVVFEGRGGIEIVAEPVALTDPRSRRCSPSAPGGGSHSNRRGLVDRE